MLIEFALSVWTLFLLTFLIFEFCMAIYTYSVLGNAAREGVRYAIAHGTDSALAADPAPAAATPTGSNVTAVVNGYASNFLSRHQRHDRHSPWPDGTSTPSSRVLVTIILSLRALPDSAGLCFAPTMQATAEGRIVF